MSHLSLKITVVELGLTKTIQFTGDMSVHEVCREIRDKFGDGAGGGDHGLLWPEEGKWLAPAKVLDYYELKSGDALEYRKKHRVLKVKMMDESLKTVLIDDSLPVSQIVEIVCDKIGITNPEEYSLLPEVLPAGWNEGKAPQAQVKLKSGKEMLAGDESRWLNPEKTLREQGLTESDTVILKKKFFFTDQNIDRNDPVQLNLLYNQAKEMIVSGRHPCTAEEASQFAAIQMQVQHGNHEPDKHKSGFVNLKEFLPPEYRKNKDVEKRIYVDHGKLQGLTELNAKFRYVQLSRSLKTYGITFFSVKEPHPKKKNTKVPILLGVTKQSVVKLDINTKEILKEWRLSTLRRWAASGNSFTMDLGDYANDYYTVETNEGEQISALISGYIDIILKKRKEAEKVVEIEEEEQATMEEYVAPSRATNVGLVPAGHRTATEGRVMPAGMLADGMRAGWGQRAGNTSFASLGQSAPSFSAQNIEITGAQQALVQSISNGFAMVNNAAGDMSVAANLPPLGNDAAAIQWKQHTVDVNAEAVAGQIAANLASTGCLINQATGYVEEMDYELIGASIATITSNLSQMAQGIKLLAGLQESSDDQERLLEAGRAVAMATAQLLETLQPVCMGQPNKDAFYNSSKAVASASSNLLSMMGRLEVSEDAQNELMDAAKSVGKTVGDLVGIARNLSSTIKDPVAQQVLMGDARAVAETAPMLSACTGVISPAITNASCLDQLMEAAMFLRDAVEALVESAGVSPNARQISTLKDGAGKVEEAIARLLDKAKKGGETVEESPLDRQYDTIVGSIDTMLEQMGSTEGIISSAKDLTLMSTQYVNMLKSAGMDSGDDEERERLLAAARGLADATSKMVVAAKDAARNTNDAQAQGRLQNAVRTLHDAVNDAAGPQLVVKAFQKLNKAVKDAIASSNQLISASRTIAQSNRNQASQLQLNTAAKRVAETTPTLVGALKNSNAMPDDQVSQMKLVQCAKQLVSPGNALVAAAKVAAPTTADSAAQTGLLTAAKQNGDDLRNLEKAIYIAEEVTAGLELRNALESLQLIQVDIADAVNSVAAMEPIEGFSAESAQLELLGSVKSLQSTISQLLSGAAQRNERVTGTAATDAVGALQTLSFAAFALTAEEPDLDLRRQLLDAARAVADALELVIGGSERALEDPSAKDELEGLAKGLNDALGGVLACLPGQRDADQAIVSIRNLLEATKDMRKSDAVSGETYQSAQTKLQVAATALTVAVNGLVRGAKGSPAELKQSVMAFQSAFAKLSDGVDMFGGIAADDAVSGKLVSLMRDVGAQCEKALLGTKSVATDSGNASFKTELASSVKGIGNLVNKLLEVCSASAPGHTECNHALQTLDGALSKLDTVNDATMNQDSYPESAAKSTSASKNLATAVSSLTGNARGGNTTKMAADAVELSNIVLAITEANVRAAHLIGTSDPSTVAASAPFIDQAAFSQAGLDIKEACKKLVDPNNTQKQILEGAGLIAKHTSALCNSCKSAGANAEVAPVAKQNFIGSAKDIANRTSQLVTNIKHLAVNPSDSARAQCEAASQPLIEAVDKLVAFAVSAEFGGTPAKVSVEAMANQRPIIEGTRGLITTAQDLVGTAKAICSNPKDEASVALLQAESRALTDSVQTLLQAVTSSAPGQKECDAALARLQESVGAVDAAIVEATVNNLAPQPGVIKGQLVDNVRALASLCDVIAKAARTDAGELGASIGELPGSLSRTTTAAVGIASNMTDTQAQMDMLEQAKELGDAVVAFVYASKSNAGNPRNTAGAQKVDEEKKRVRTAVGKLVTTLEGSRDESGEFGKAVERIETLVSSLDTKIPSRTPQSYQVYGAEIDVLGKQFVETVGEIIGKAKTPAQFRALAAQIGELYDKIGTTGGNGVCAVEDAQVKTKLQDALREMGGSSIKLIEAMRLASGKSAADSVSRLKLTQAAREVSNTIAHLMNVAKEGSKGLAKCQEAVGNINTTIADLESTMIFASAGQLDPMDVKDNFSRHKDGLLGAARQLTELVKGFITAVTGTQDELGNVATSAVLALEALRGEVRKGATSITSSDKHMQQQLLGAAKAVSEALQGLISSAANACGRPAEDPAMNELADAVKLEFQSLAELIRVTRLLGDEASRGTRALDGAVSDVDDSITVLESPEPAQGSALPDEVAGLAKQLASAAAALVASANGKQDEVVAASNAIKKQVGDLVRAAKAATEKAPAEQKAQMTDAVKRAATAVKYLLGRIKALQESNTPANKVNVQAGAKEVAQSVNAILAAAGSLIPGGYVDPNDPNVVAERELLAAANSIEGAARKLAQLAPPERPRAVNEDLNFEEQILEAAKAIAAATAALVRSATGAQREIVAKGLRGPREEAMYFSDGTWSEGLVSAAKLVAASTGDLCEAANMAVKGTVQRERVIVSARSVSASTVQLLSAATARADANSQAQIRLRAAGKAVTNATDHLVRAAEENMAFDDTDQISSLMQVAGAGGVMKGRVAEMEAQMSILKMEKELEKARNRLAAVRKGKYDAAKGGHGDSAAGGDKGPLARATMKRSPSRMGGTLRGGADAGPSQ
ncbi:Talin-1 [Borealophlyctis nickersoniae]|nr:Talin-1 [Borealophlyctis nickersoniae]